MPVYLFGSRADDDLSGGDIDLAIDVEMDKEQFWQCKVQFKTALLQMGFDQIEVDVVDALSYWQDYAYDLGINKQTVQMIRKKLDDVYAQNRQLLK